MAPNTDHKIPKLQHMKITQGNNLINKVQHTVLADDTGIFIMITVALSPSIKHARCQRLLCAHTFNIVHQYRPCSCSVRRLSNSYSSRATNRKSALVNNLFLSIVYLTDFCQYSGKWMCHLWNMATCDYKESVTTGSYIQTKWQTDRRKTEWNLCAAMLCRQLKNMC